MSKVYAFIADGMEEVECLAAMDVLVRAGVEVTLVAIGEKRQVTGSHHFTVMADRLFSEIDPADADVLFLPGGMPGTNHLAEFKPLGEALKAAVASGRRVAAICAAPSVLGDLGILEGRRAICYPGFEERLKGAEVAAGAGVVTDGNVTTARGLGWALDLGLELTRLLKGQETARKIKAAIQYDQC